MNTGTQL